MQVDRLKALIDNLSKNAGSIVESQKGQTHISPNASSKQTDALASHASSPYNGASESDAHVGDLNLKSLDVCEALGQLTVSDVIRLDAHQPQRAPIITEVEIVYLCW